ncbi:MAG: Lrp/AsnC family transcriptional regulator [Pseudomonadota bacterium]
MDKIDRTLLAAMQINARMTAEKLGDVCGLSPTAALKRLKRLRTDGVIDREVAVLSPKAVGLNTMVIALVSLERESKDAIDNFKRAILNTPQIVEGYYITGEADFFLTIITKDIEAYEEFTRDFFYEKLRIKTFKSLVVMDAIKSQTPVPL